jgi:hypothetical protein
MAVAAGNYLARHTFEPAAASRSSSTAAASRSSGTAAATPFPARHFLGRFHKTATVNMAVI